MHRAAIPIAILVLALAATTRADTVWIRSGGGELEIKDVKISGISGGNLVFASRGAQTTRPLDQVARLAVDGEPAFNEAESAFAAKRYEAAVDGYEKAVRASSRPWVKEWASGRLLDAAVATGRFDAAVTGYVVMLQNDPASAAARKPPLPDAKSAYIDSAVKEVEKALTQKLNDAQRRALLSYLLELQRVKGDNKAIEQTLAQLTQLSGGDAQSDVAAQSLAQLKLAAARAALDSGDHAKAAAEVNGNRGVFIDPQQQAEALYLLAEAKMAQASQSKDPADLKDAGLAYMRVVSHFRDAPGQPRVADALLKAAAVHELLGEKETALRVYQQVAGAYRDQPQAAAATRKIEELSAQ